MNNPANNRIPIIAGISVGVVAVIAIALFAYTSISRAGKVAVPVYTIPSDASLTIDGKSASAGTAYLAPGKHSAQLSKDGFTTSAEDYTITAGGEAEAIDLALQPASADALTWYNAHKDLYSAREGRGGLRSAKFGDAFHAVNPITKKLPYTNYLYSIGYTLDPADPTGNSIIIQIDSPTGYRNGAVAQIRNLGFDPTDFNINFSGYKDPFSL